MQSYPQGDPEMPDIRERASRSTSRVALAFFVLMAVSQVAALIIQMIVLRFFRPVASAGWFLWTVTIVSLYCFAAPCAYLILRDVPATVPERRRMSAKTTIIFLFMAFTLLMGGALIGQGVNNVIGFFFGKQDSQITEAMANSPLWLSCLYSLLIAPLLEEFFFRKLLIDRLGFLGDWSAILLSGIAFGLFHGNLEQFFYAALLGMLLALVYLKTGNVLYTVLIHSVVNFFGGILPTIIDHYLPLDLAGAETNEQLIALIRSQPLSAAAHLLAAYLPYIFAFVGLVFLCLYFRRMTTGFRPSPLPRGGRAAPIVGNVGSILYLVVCIGSMILTIASNALT